MKTLFVSVSLCLALLATATPSAQAAVWSTTQRWDRNQENRYSEWVRTSWRVDIFQSADSPYRGLFPDCADSIYSPRAIFAFQNSLPFAIVDPSTRRTLISNEISKFDRIPAGPARVKAFLQWLYGVVGTKSLPNDSYPVAITRESVRPGAFILAAENKHSYLIKRLKDTGVPHLYYSTQKNRGNLKERSWPSIGYLFPQGVKQPSGLRDFRWPEFLLRPVWEVPGYSDEQYRVPASQWIQKMQSRLAFRAESGEELLRRHMEDACQLAQTRVDLVTQAEKRRVQLGNTCLNAAEYDDLSTPGRDKQARADFDLLVKAYAQVAKNREPISASLAQQLANIFAASIQNETGSEQYCRIQYAPGRFMTFGEFRRRLYAGQLSSNPNAPLSVRWGDQAGPSEKARRCPQY